MGQGTPPASGKPSGVGVEGVCPYAAYAGSDQMLLRGDGRCDIHPMVADGGAVVVLRHIARHLTWLGCGPGCYLGPPGHL